MNTNKANRTSRRMRVWAGCLGLAGLLCLDAWLVCSVARGWPYLAGAGVPSTPSVDLALVFNAR